MSFTLILNGEHKDAKDFFEINCWYQGKPGTNEQGITTKFTGNLNANPGWWGPEFADGYFRLMTPELWVKVTNPEKIKELESKLILAMEKWKNPEPIVWTQVHKKRVQHTIASIAYR